MLAMGDFKFIHAADLHLESPYRGVSGLNADLGAALVEGARRGFDRLIDCCIEEKVDFLVLAGDNFDSESGSLGTQFRFFRGLQRLGDAGIKVYVICGNHDPLGSWARNYQLPDNVYRFGSDEVERVEFVRGGEVLAALYGVSYAQREEYRRLVERYRRQSGDPFAIGVLHGAMSGCDGHDPYCPFSLEDLLGAQMDYWALGHIHKREVLRESEPMVVYPGNLQGRHFNEAGSKGCYLLEVEGGRLVNSGFLPLSQIEYHWLDLDASDFTATSDLFDALSLAQQEFSQRGVSVLLRVRLTGVCKIFDDLADPQNLKRLVEEFNEDIDFAGGFVYLDRIDNRSQPCWSEMNGSAGGGFEGNEFLQSLNQRFEELAARPEELEQMIEEILGPLKGSAAGRPLLGQPLVSADLLDGLDAARRQCLASLHGGTKRTRAGDDG